MTTDGPSETSREANVRPVVAARRPSDRGPWVFAAVAVLGAVLLFSALDSRRRAASAPATRARVGDIAAIPASPPPLYIPLLPATPAKTASVIMVTPTPTPPPRAMIAPPPPPPATIYPTLPPSGASPPPPARQAPGASGAVLVYDASAPTPATPAGAGGSDQPAAAVAIASGTGRSRAARLAGQRTTVPQGTLIPAVLETALDSTRAGQARALVSRDVRGFDGSRVLIPRGSRLYGEYKADLAPGQNRALVQWVRLVRPDGVTIAIDSPAGDELGRAGIRGKVNSHFFERFGAALLQTSLDLGVSLAAQSAGNGAVILALPRGGSALGQATDPSQVRPTLTVPQGTRVTVFAARDLDFGSVEGR